MIRRTDPVISEAIFTNLGSTNTSYDDNVNAYLTTGVGGAGLSFEYWCATKYDWHSGWFFYSHSWSSTFSDYRSNKLRPVLGFHLINPTSINGTEWTLTEMPAYDVELEVEYFTYAITVKEGTLYATSWQGKAGEGNYQALPLEGVTAGTALSVKYNGTKKVKSVKAKKKAAAYTMAAAATSADKGKLICTDGHIHAYSEDRACTKARVAQLIYIGPTGHDTYTHGLALALTDEASTMAWGAAIDACSAKNVSTPVTDATWLLASKDQWDYMMGADGAGSYSALRDGFMRVAGRNMQSDGYWSSTEGDPERAWYYDFNQDHWRVSSKDYANCVRACLAFGVQEPDPIELTSTDGETWTLASMPDYDVELEVTYYPTHAITVKEGTLDATSWQGKAGEGEYQALPLEGVTAGTALSVKYNGTKKVKSVKAKGKPAAEATAEDKGKLIGRDGIIYDTKDEAEDAGTTAVAKIIYIGPTGHATYNHGLALALTDEGPMEWGAAMTACNNKNTSTPVTGATWLLASREQWEYMMGPDGAGSSDALRDGFSSVGGSNLLWGMLDPYWSSTENGSDNGWRYSFYYGTWIPVNKGNEHHVRACLAFGAQGSGPDPIELTSTDGKTWTLASMPYYDVKLEVEYETELALSETTDNSAALTEWNGYEADVTLTRTLAAGSYNTFAAPFSTAIPDDWTVKELTSATFADGTLTLNFTNAASIEAGKPYLVKVTDDTNLSTAPFTGVIVSKDAQPFTSTDVDFIPTLGATTVPDGDTKAVLFLAAGNKLKNPSALPADMKGFRAYFQLKGEAALAKSFNIDFGNGETTGIISIEHGTLNIDHSVYDLQGRRISKATQKGVYIQNGNKVVIK